MFRSGKERLCYDLCRKCWLEKEKGRLRKKYENLPWTKWDDERFGEWFITEWEREEIECALTGERISVWEKPDKCPRGAFRHLIGLVYYRGNPDVGLKG